MSTPLRNRVGIRGVARVLPPTRLTLEQLSARRMIVSSPADLASFGFRAVHVADAVHNGDWLIAVTRGATEPSTTGGVEVDTPLGAQVRGMPRGRRSTGGPGVTSEPRRGVGPMDRVRRRNYQLELRCPGERAVVVGVFHRQRVQRQDARRPRVLDQRWHPHPAVPAQRGATQQWELLPA